MIIIKIVQPKITIKESELAEDKLKTIEDCARICYKSTPKDSVNKNFIRGLIKSGHESVIEHEKITVLIKTDRAIANEIVRHRIASYSQVSTRYVNYFQDRFGNEIECVKPVNMDIQQEARWMYACESAESIYLDLTENHTTPEVARSVLPLSLATELYVTMNFRSWRNFLKLRVDKSSHPDIRRLAIPLLIEFQKHFEPIFGDIEIPEDFPTHFYAEVEFI